MKIVKNLESISLSKTHGRFLADKSYAYDTVYFMSLFIRNNLLEKKYFNKFENKKSYIDYTADIFLLKIDSSGIQNYMGETLNLLEFCQIIQQKNQGVYEIIDLETLDFITERLENSYIFLYLTVYYTFENDNIIGLYRQFLRSSDLDAKKQVLLKIHQEFLNKSVSIDRSDTNWSKQLVKYALIVLNFLNQEKLITRTLNIKELLVSNEDIVINVAGTRTPENYREKINDYIYNFDLGYVQKTLQEYIFSNIDFSVEKNETYVSEAQRIAMLKLDLLTAPALKKKLLGEIQSTPYSLSQEGRIITVNEDREQYVESTIKTRNSAIQYAFRKNLLTNLKNECVICGFSFANILVAGHIVPYSKCDSVHDAVDLNNGLLFCPNHDKLFESGKYITIHYQTGEILINENVKTHLDLIIIKGKIVSEDILTPNRRKYLKRHNLLFNGQNID